MDPASDRVQGFLSENKRRRRHRKTFLALRMPTLCINRDLFYLRIVRAGGAPCIVDSTVIQIIIFSRPRHFRAEDDIHTTGRILSLQYIGNKPDSLLMGRRLSRDTSNNLYETTLLVLLVLGAQVSTTTPESQKKR